MENIMNTHETDAKTIQTAILAIVIVFLSASSCRMYNSKQLTYRYIAEQIYN